MKRISFFLKKILGCIFILALALCGWKLSNIYYSSKTYEYEEYNGSIYIEVNHNIPSFTKEEQEKSDFETYSKLDSLGRCTQAFAMISEKMFPTEEREDISSIFPSGWNQATYDIVENGNLYNRCHLIAFCLTGENANERNLITGTRYFNVEGMEPFEMEVYYYILNTHHHVLYRVTPIFKGRELVARGVEMEALSIEDNGEGISFHVFVYNVQPGIVIDYKTGESHLES